MVASSKPVNEADPGGIAVGEYGTVYQFFHTTPGGTVSIGSDFTSAEFKPAVHPGVTWGAVTTRAQERIALCVQRVAQHDTNAYRWRRVAEPLAWLTALLAALSGISVVADTLEVATVLAIVTAFAAATNAALSPGETTRKHRGSALAYDKLRLKVEDYAFFDLGSHDAGEPIPDEDLEGVRDTLRGFDEEINSTAVASAPLRGI